MTAKLFRVARWAVTCGFAVGISACGASHPMAQAPRSADPDLAAPMVETQLQPAPARVEDFVADAPDSKRAARRERPEPPPEHLAVSDDFVPRPHSNESK